MQETKQIHVRFAAVDERNDSEWSSLAYEALEQVGVELEQEGTDVNMEAQSSSQAGDRGFGVDDVLISVATNVAASAIYSLLSKLVEELSHRLRRKHGTQAVQTIVLQAGDQQLRIATSAPAELTYAQLSLWAPTVINADELVIKTDDTTP